MDEMWERIKCIRYDTRISKTNYEETIEAKNETMNNTIENTRSVGRIRCLKIEERKELKKKWVKLRRIAAKIFHHKKMNTTLSIR